MTATTSEFFLDIEPFPAERVACACRGRFPSVYNKPKYKEWLSRAIDKLDAVAATAEDDLTAVRENPVEIWIEAIRPRPKSTKLYAPLGDNDNYEKGLWDAISKSGHWWADDRQITDNHTTKRWAEPGEPAGFRVKMEFQSNIPYSS